MKHSREEIIKNIQEVGQLIGDIPTRRAYNQHPHRLCSATTIVRNYFRSWKKALKAAGFKNPRGKRLLITYEDFLQNVQNIIHKVGHVITSDEYGNHPDRICSKAYMFRYFRSWSKILRDLGYEAFSARNFSNEEILEDLYHTALKHPEIHRIYKLIDLGKYSRHLYRLRFKTSENIKQQLFKLYGLQIKKPILRCEQYEYSLQQIRNFVEEYNHIPTIEELKECCGINIASLSYRHPGLQATDLVYAAIGTTNRITPHFRKASSSSVVKKLILQDINRIYEQLKSQGAVRYNDVSKKLYAIRSHLTVKKYFGSIKNAIAESKIPVQAERTYYTNEDLLKTLQIIAKDIGHAPSSTQYNKHPLRTAKSAKTFYKRFKSWNNALLAAGLKVS